MKRPESIGWDPDDYDLWYRKEPGKTIDLIETECVLSMLLPVGGRKVLDVGCGTGNFTEKLKVLGYDVVGVEPHGGMRKRAIEKGLNCVEGVAEDLPFEDESFSAVVSVAAIEFFQDVDKAISEMMRVTKRGGKIVIGFITGPWARFYEEKGREGHPIFSHARFPKLEEFLRYASDMKFCLRSLPVEEVSFEKEKSIQEAGFVCVLIEKPL